MTLAARLGRCAVSAPADVDTALLRGTEHERRHADIDRIVESLTSGTDGTVNTPDAPIPWSEVWVLLLVVGLTAASVAAFAPEDRGWKKKRDWERLSLTIIVGLGSFAEYGLLCWKERQGARWIASITFKSVDVAVSNTTGDCIGLPYSCTGNTTGLEGSSVFMSQTFAVGSTNGYWPLTLLLIGCGALLLCVVVSTLFVGFQLRRGVKRRSARGGRQHWRQA